MATNIENLAEKTSKLSIDTIYDKNWCDMPADIKLECIGKMELRERLSLRCTAKAEKSLVDSEKIYFARGKFQIMSNEILLFSMNGIRCTKRFKSENDMFEFIRYIWSVGVFEEIQFYSLAPVDPRHLFPNNTGNVSTRNIDFKWSSIQTAVSILHKIKNPLESVKFNADMDMLLPFYPLDEILALPHVKNASYCHVKYIRDSASVVKAAQMLIENNSKIGTIFGVSCKNDGSDGAFNGFLRRFASRVVSKTEKRARIRTNNPENHILLERGIDDVVGISRYPQFFRVIVISAGMKESEYDENCTGWMEKMSPEYYDGLDFSDQED
ncbi:unnamed protein product [Caenorhabditis nigoni]